MEQLATTDLRRLIAHRHSGPCISIYLPFGIAGRVPGQASRRLQKLLQEAQERLKNWPPELARSVLQPLQKFLSKLPQLPMTEGLALFVSRKVAGFLPVQEKLGELLVVADSFHVKPLLRIIQAQTQHMIVHLEPSRIRFYEGSQVGIEDRETFINPVYRHALRTSLNLAGPAEGLEKMGQERQMLRFLKSVDQSLRLRLQKSHAPVVLMGPDELVERFRKVSRYRNIVGQLPEIGPYSSDREALQRAVWHLVRPVLARQELRLLRDFRVMQMKQKTLDNLAEICQAAASGKVSRLLLGPCEPLMGRVDPQTGALDLERRASDQDDVYDDLAELVLERGGQVYVLEQEKIPTASRLAAILR